MLGFKESDQKHRQFGNHLSLRVSYMFFIGNSEIGSYEHSEMKTKSNGTT